VKGQNFFKIEMVSNGTLQGPIMTILHLTPEIVILAMGMTLVMACTGGVDMSVGSVMVLSAAVGIRALGFMSPYKMEAMYEYDAPLVFFFVGCVVAGALCGAWNGFLVSKLKVRPVVATLILLVTARTGAKIVMGQAHVPVFVDSFRWAGNYFPGADGKAVIPIPTSVFIAIAVVALTWLMVRFTALGTNIQAVGVNAKASRIVGLKPSRIIWLVFVFAGVCSGIAGIVAASRLNLVDTRFTGGLMELDVIWAVLLGGNSLAGGRFSLMGSVIGAVTVLSLKTGLLTAGVGFQVMPFYLAMIVLVVLVIRSEKLRGMAVSAVTRLRGVARPLSYQTVEVTP